MRRLATALASVLLSLWAARALASPLDVQVFPTAIAGQGKPALVVTATEPATSVQVILVRSGCGPAREVKLRAPKLAAGTHQRFDLDQPSGHCDYRGSLVARFGGQPAELPLTFSTDLLGAPEVKVLAHGLDLASHTVRVTFTRDADHGTVEAFGETGALLGTVSDQNLGDARPGEPLSLSFEGGAGPVLRLRVTIFDPGGIFAAVDLFPWSLEIPHQEVVFANGSAEIPASERPKLEESQRRIEAAVARIGAQAPLRLFVVGYTDTVGSAEANQALSAARARSLGEFFRRAGLRLPILTAGLGEAALAVATADDTPEPRNRRAEYLLAVDPPTIAGAARLPAWSSAAAPPPP